MGGTCTNAGCIPTKTMLASSRLLTRMQEAQKFGLHADAVTLDFAGVMTRKDQVVLRLRKGIEYLMKKNRIQVYASHATLEGCDARPPGCDRRGGRGKERHPGNGQRASQVSALHRPGHLDE